MEDFEATRNCGNIASTNPEQTEPMYELYDTNIIYDFSVVAWILHMGLKMKSLSDGHRQRYEISIGKMLFVCYYAKLSFIILVKFLSILLVCQVIARHDSTSYLLLKLSKHIYNQIYIFCCLLLISCFTFLAFLFANFICKSYLSFLFTICIIFKPYFTSTITLPPKGYYPHFFYLAYNCKVKFVCL